MNDSPASTAPANLARVASLFAAVALAGATLAACGGGGGSSPTPSPAPAPTPTPTPSPSPTPTPSPAPTPTPTPSPSPTPAGPLASEQLTGAIDYIHDPAVIRQGSTYYVFSTDGVSTASGFIPIVCTSDKVVVTACGHVFSTLPSWIATTVPAATTVWAPDISYFNGTYHLYYAVSSFGVNKSAIGLATNTTLDRGDPAYAWVDQGVVLQSTSSNDYNAIDPNIAIDDSNNVWLSYGSFWDGIFQQQIDPATGLLKAGTTATHLAERASSVQYDPIEGANLVEHNGYWYLFTSWDYCCQSTASASNYKIVVGRGTSPNGPFTDQSGVALTAGGGTILLQGTSTYGAPGGASVLMDSVNGDVIVFHALDLTRNGVPVLFMKSLTWTSDWPVIGD